MDKICDYCGGQGKWQSGVSVVTGEVFYTTCPRCGGSGWIKNETPPVKALTDEEKRELASKQMKENIQRSQDLKTMQDAIRISPSSFIK